MILSVSGDGFVYGSSFVRLAGQPFEVIQVAPKVHHLLRHFATRSFLTLAFLRFFLHDALSYCGAMVSRPVTFIDVWFILQ